jgi:phosphoglucosamine mutase
MEEYALPVSQKKPLENLTHLRERCEFLRTHQFRSRGRILIRYSGTESKLRLLVEGPDPSTNKTGLDALVRAAQEDLKIF